MRKDVDIASPKWIEQRYTFQRHNVADQMQCLSPGQPEGNHAQRLELGKVAEIPQHIGQDKQSDTDDQRVSQAAMSSGY